MFYPLRFDMVWCINQHPALNSCLHQQLAHQLIRIGMGVPRAAPSIHSMRAISIVLVNEFLCLKSRRLCGIMENSSTRIGSTGNQDLEVVDPLVSVISPLRLLVGSSCNFRNWGFFHKKVEMVAGLDYGDGGYCSFSGKLSLIYKYRFFFRLFFLLCMFIPGIVSIRSHCEESLGSRLYFVFEFHNECKALGGFFPVQSSKDIYFGFAIPRSARSAKISSMDNIDILELTRIMRRREESIQSNRSSLFSMTTKVHRNEHHCIS